MKKLSILNKKFKLKNIIIILSYFFIFFIGISIGLYKHFPFNELQNLKKLIFVEKNHIGNRKNDPMHFQRRVSQFELFDYEAEITVVGDSLIEFGLWNEFFPFRKISNRGVRGDTTADIILRMNSILSTKPKYVLIMVGINDLYKEIPLSQIIDNYEYIIDKLKTKNIIILIQSTIQCQRSVCGNQIKKIKLLNENLEKLSKEKNIMYINLNSLLSNKYGLKPEYTWDGIHLNAKGYRIWVNEIKSILNKI